MRDPCLFGDYRNTLTEDVRLYEDVVDYDASKAIFEEVRMVVVLLRIIMGYVAVGVVGVMVW